MSGSAIGFSPCQFVSIFVVCALSVMSIMSFALQHCVICSAALSLCHQPVLFSLCICALAAEDRFHGSTCVVHSWWLLIV